MYRHFVLGALAAAVTIAPALAQDSEATNTSKPAKEKKICHRDVATGSVMPHTTCHTKSEWDALSANSQDELRRARDTARMQQSR